MSASEVTPPARRPRKPPTQPAPEAVAAIAPQPVGETPEQIEARVRAEIEAKVRAEIEAQYAAPDADTLVPDFVGAPEDAPEAVTIHFVEDGFTAFGQIWYRGQELTVAPGTPEWESLTDRNGVQTLWMLFDEDQQIARWGKRFFRPGKWRGAGFDVDDPLLDDAERNTLLALMGKNPVATSGSKPSFLASGTT